MALVNFRHRKLLPITKGRDTRMAQAHETSGGRTSSGNISTAWRVFQIVALLTAISWLVSYALFVSPFGWVGGLFSGELPAYGDVVFDLSPIVSIFIIALAVFPERLSFLTNGNGIGTGVTRAVLFVLPLLWMINVMFGGSPMVDKLITVPLDASRMIPLPGGVFLHVVMQHWFQSIAAIALALAPQQFSTLTESSTPAGVQCAVVDC